MRDAKRIRGDVNDNHPGPEVYLRYALDYADQGFRVIPLVRRGKRPLLERWPDRGSLDRDQITEWFQTWPGSNIGLLTGDGLIVLDVDTKNGGKRSFRRLLKRRRLPETAHALTGSGGRHYLFRVDPTRRIKNINGLEPGIDIKGDRGMFVVEPSVHPSTSKEYVWLREPRSGIADAPSWLVKRLSERGGEESPLVPSQPLRLMRDGDEARLLADAIERFSVSGHGQRNSQMARLVASLLGRGYNPLLTELVVTAWWEHFHAQSLIRTSPTQAAREIGNSIAATLKNPKFRRAMAKDHMAVCRGIRMEPEKARLLEEGYVSPEGLLQPPTPPLLSKGVTEEDESSRMLCQTRQEQAFVEALVVHFTHVLCNLDDPVMKATFGQIGEIMNDRRGVKLDHPPQIERLKRRYVSRQGRPADRFELVVQTVTGRTGVPSEFELTGLLQLLSPEALEALQRRSCGTTVPQGILVA